MKTKNGKEKSSVKIKDDIPKKKLKQKSNDLEDWKDKMSHRDLKNFNRFRSFFEPANDFIASNEPKSPPKNSKLVRNNLQRQKIIPSRVIKESKDTFEISRPILRNPVNDFRLVDIKENNKISIRKNQFDRELLSPNYKETFRFRGAIESRYLQPLDGSLKRRRGYTFGKDLPVLGPYYYHLKIKHPR